MFCSGFKVYSWKNICEQIGQNVDLFQLFGRLSGLFLFVDRFFGRGCLGASLFFLL